MKEEERKNKRSMGGGEKEVGRGQKGRMDKVVQKSSRDGWVCRKAQQAKK